MARSKVKITVFKRVDPSIIFDGEVPNCPWNDEKYTICTAFKDDQEFVVGLDGNKPEGFCGWAWRDIYKDLSPQVRGRLRPLGGEGHADDLLHRRNTACVLQAREIGRVAILNFFYCQP